MANQAQAFYGTVIHSESLTSLNILENSLLIVDNGVVHSLHPGLPISEVSKTTTVAGYSDLPVKYLEPTEFLIPGFVDSHNHAPQWTQRGLGRGISLLDWLDKLTFAHEARFQDVEYAKKTYTSCVNGFLKQGTTTAAYYGSRHGAASKTLADVCLSLGQRALIGKCNMDRNAPDWYRDASAEESLVGTRDFIAYVRQLDPEKKLITPIITPRFAISCDDVLLRGLGDLAMDNRDLPIQTHFNEAYDEINYTRSLFPNFTTEADLYEHFNLLNSRSILAHCIFLHDSEIARLQSLNCGIAHCPISNTTMQTFMVAPVREYLRRNIKLGLGTDSGGGYASSMLEVMKSAFTVSVARQTETNGKDPALSIDECFFLATLGGAAVCGLEHRIGSFAPGKEFDACLVKTDVDGVMAPAEEGDSTRDVLEKFLMTGDDRNIARVYVRGRVVKDVGSSGR